MTSLLATFYHARMNCKLIKIEQNPRRNLTEQIKGCVRYIFASLFLSLNESTCQTGKYVFYFTSKALFILEKIKF